MCLRLRADFVLASRRGELVMPVRLDQLPPLAPRPGPPRFWLWFAMLLVFLLVSTGLMLVFTDAAWQSRASRFWDMALGVPLLLWSVLGFIRALLFMAQQRAADGWDQARESDRLQRITRGQRSLEVLAVSVHSALRQPADLHGTLQLAALLNGAKALKAQPSRAGEMAVRHCRLGGATGKPLEVLQHALTQVLADLAPTLLPLPEQTPLAVLLTFDGALPEPELQDAWRQAWSACGIHQTAVMVTGSGLDAVDQWLDQRPTDHALRLVVALRIAPQPLEDSAEVAVGLLLGNRPLPTNLAPLARLHRPERAARPEPVSRAARQALDWASLSVPAVVQVWRAGLDTACDPVFTTVLSDLAMLAEHKDSLCDLDAQLGHAGEAAPWLAIAAAAQNIAQGAGPQFIFSGTSLPDDGLWCTAVTPTVALDTSGV